MNRRLTIALTVVLLHLAGLWALQQGLLHRFVEIIVPVKVLSELLVPTPAAPPPKPPAPVLQPPIKPASPPPVQPAPQPLATPSPNPSPAAPQGVATPQLVMPPINTPQASASPQPVAPVVRPAPLELPSSNAAYLNNPKPAYPALSKRLGEQGTVTVRVLIGVDGTAQQAEISQSSGFARLDQAALAVVLKWRYVPGKRGGIPEAMWFNVPISFVLE